MLAVLAAGLVLAPVTAAEPPFRVPDYVTDRAGVLSEGQRVQVENAVNQLYNDNRTRLWVVYVDSFGQGAVGWARTTMQISDFGDRDALLAIATEEGAYAFQVPSAVMSQSDAAALQRNTIEPALRRDDWTGAAVAAANGLDTPSTSTGPSTLRLHLVRRARRAGPPRPRDPGAVVVDPPAPAQAARSRVRRGPAGGPVGPERVGRGADRRARRSLQGHRGRRRQCRAHQ